MTDLLTSTRVAYRGLWDKFAAPESLDAIRRAYSRGIPSLVRLGHPKVDLREVMALVADPAVNRRHLPVYLETERPSARAGVRRARREGPETDTPGLPAVQDSTPSWLRVFAIAADSGALTWPVFRWNRRAWIRVGVYVPVTTLLTGIDGAAADLRGAPFILFESPNVIADRRHAAGLADEDIALSIHRSAGPHVSLTRVSDLVELDELDARVHEAG